MRGGGKYANSAPYAPYAPLLPRRDLSSRGAEARSRSQKFVFFCSRSGPRSRQRAQRLPEARGRIAAPDRVMVSSSDRHRETPPTSTKPTTKTTMSCEAMDAASSIARSPPRSRCRCGPPPPSPLIETAGGAARRAQRQGGRRSIFTNVLHTCCLLLGHF